MKSKQTLEMLLKQAVNLNNEMEQAIINAIIMWEIEQGLA